MRNFVRGCDDMRLFRTGFLLLIVVAAFAVASGASAAGNGSVSIVPPSSTVEPGSNVTVSVVEDPPAVGTSIWIVRVAFDHNVLQYLSCTPMPSPGGGIAQAAACDVAGSGDFVTFGGWVENRGGVAHGFETPQTLGTVTFRAIANPLAHSDLNVSFQAMLGPNGEVETPEIHNGAIDVVGPVGGTVEMLSQGAGGSAVPSAAFLAPALALAGPLAVAFALRRRIIGR